MQLCDIPLIREHSTAILNKLTPTQDHMRIQRLELNGELKKNRAISNTFLAVSFVLQGCNLLQNVLLSG